MTLLLDTMVVSELRRSAPDRNVTAWLTGIRPVDLRISVMTVGELRRGVERLRRRDVTQAGLLDAWLVRLLDQFGDQVLPVSAQIADTWGRLGVPDPLPLVDGILAATAAVHGCTLVTRNTRDFERTGIALVNPFDPTSSMRDAAAHT
jgi:predicted nucleic acid-binding protein